MPQMGTRIYQAFRRSQRHLPGLACGLLLGVLIPLACVLHCLRHAPSGHAGHADHAGHGGHHHAPVARPASTAAGHTPDGHDHRLCGMHADEIAAGMDYPRALYELTPLAAPALVVVVALLGAAAARARLGDAGRADAPLTPPPQPLPLS